MSQTKTISDYVVIHDKQMHVFNAVTNWEAQNKWILFTKVKGVGNNSHVLGGKLEAFTGIGPLGFLDTMTISKWDLPHSCKVTHTGNFVKGAGLFKVTKDEQGSKFTWTEYFDVPSGILGNLIWAVLYIPTKIGLKISLFLFKKHYSSINKDKSRY